MDIKELQTLIVSRIKSFFSKAALWSIIKEAVKLPYAKTYISLAFFMTFVFLIITFPYDMLIRNRLDKLEGQMFKTFNIKEIDFNFIGKTYLNKIYIVLRSGSEISVNSAEIDFSINPITLLIKNVVKGSLQLNQIKYQSGDTSVLLNLNGNIYLDFDSFSKMPSSGNVKFMAQNAVITINTITVPGMGGLEIPIEPFKIKSMMLESSLTGKKLNLSNVRISGDDLRGNITGSIAIGKMFINSRLDLKINIDADSKVISKFHDELSSLITNNTLTIPLKGTIARPRPDLKMMRSPETPSLPQKESRPNIPVTNGTKPGTKVP